jgi:hypothetical protein
MAVTWTAEDRDIALDMLHTLDEKGWRQYNGIGGWRLPGICIGEAAFQAYKHRGTPVSNLGFGYLPIIAKIHTYLGLPEGKYVSMHWNDAPDTTEDDVKGLLKEIATS